MCHATFLAQNLLSCSFILSVLSCRSFQFPVLCKYFRKTNFPGLFQARNIKARENLLEEGGKTAISKEWLVLDIRTLQKLINLPPNKIFLKINKLTRTVPGPSATFNPLPRIATSIREYKFTHSIPRPNCRFNNKPICATLSL